MVCLHYTLHYVVTIEKLLSFHENLLIFQLQCDKTVSTQFDELNFSINLNLKHNNYNEYVFTYELITQQ